VSPASDETWREHLLTDTQPPAMREASVRASLPGLTILAHPEAGRIGERVSLPDLRSGRPVRISRLEPGFSHPGETLRRALGTLYLSRSPILLQPAEDGGLHLSCRETRTAVEADLEPVDGERTFTAKDLARGVVLLLAQKITLVLHGFCPVFEPIAGHGMEGKSDALQEVRRRIDQVAGLDLPVLVRGETGSGKELVARALHQAGRRRDRPFVPVNMGAIPPSLAAAELFGSEKGSFTGADRRRQGFFNRAHGGTLFLDEIGEVPPEVQPLLLRALETGEIQRVGSDDPFKVDVRIVAATDADLEQAIGAQRFRAPLLHRLGGYEIRLPPLRERRDDFGRLLFHFVRDELSALGQAHLLTDRGPDGSSWLPAPLVARLAAWSWPGNVRQLRNVARQLAIESRSAAEAQAGPELEALLGAPGSGLRPPPPVRPPLEKKPEPAAGSARRFRSPREVSDDELVEALRANGWEPGAAARQLGISRPAVYALIDASRRVRKGSDLGREEVEDAFRHCGGRFAEMAARLEVSLEALKRRIKQLGLRGDAS
jgi:two-component system, NtrC family, nitrogen regulation response regulator GlnG